MENRMGIISIMRGIPGSGKSTKVQDLINHTQIRVVSADDYFIGKDGVYRYDPKKIHKAHTECMQKFLKAIWVGFPRIIVDNTNLNHWEYMPYVSVGEAMGYNIEFIQMHGEPGVCARHNIHGVPYEAIQRMVRRKQELLPFLRDRYKVTHYYYMASDEEGGVL